MTIYQVYAMSGSDIKEILGTYMSQEKANSHMEEIKSKASKCKDCPIHHCDGDHIRGGMIKDLLKCPNASYYYHYPNGYECRNDVSLCEYVVKEIEVEC